MADPVKFEIVGDAASVVDAVNQAVQAFQGLQQKIANSLQQTLPSLQRFLDVAQRLADRELFAQASKYAEAIQSIGGAAKLTSEEMARASDIVGAAVDRYKELGVEAPQALQDLQQSLKDVSSATTQVAEDVGKADESIKATAADMAAAFDGVKETLSTLGDGATLQDLNAALATTSEEIEKLGGVAELTADQQAELADGVDALVERYHELGEDVPAQLTELQESLEATSATHEKLAETAEAAGKATTNAVKDIDKATVGAADSVKTLDEALDDVDADRLTKGLQKVEEELADLSDVTDDVQDRLSDLVEAVADVNDKFQELAEDIPDAVEAATSETDELGASVVRTGDAADESAKTDWVGWIAAITGATTISAGLTSALTIVLTKIHELIHALPDMIDLTKEAGDRFLTMSQQTGLSVGFLSKLDFAAQQAGASLESVVAAQYRFTLAIKNGSEDTRKALDKLGISIKDLQKQSQDERLLTLFRKLAEQDLPNKLSLGLTLLGKSFRNFSQLASEDLEKLMDDAERLGIVFDEKTSVAADRYGDALNRLGRTMDGLKYQIGGSLLPAVIALVETFNEGLLKALEESGIKSENLEVHIENLVKVFGKGIEILVRSLGVASDVGGKFFADFIRYNTLGVSALNHFQETLANSIKVTLRFFEDFLRMAGKTADILKYVQPAQSGTYAAVAKEAKNAADSVGGLANNIENYSASISKSAADGIVMMLRTADTAETLGKKTRDISATVADTVAGKFVGAYEDVKKSLDEATAAHKRFVEAGGRLDIPASAAAEAFGKSVEALVKQIHLAEQAGLSAEEVFQKFGDAALKLYTDAQLIPGALSRIPPELDKIIQLASKTKLEEIFKGMEPARINQVRADLSALAAAVQRDFAKITSGVGVLDVRTLKDKTDALMFDLTTSRMNWRDREIAIIKKTHDEEIKSLGATPAQYETYYDQLVQLKQAQLVAEEALNEKARVKELETLKKQLESQGLRGDKLKAVYAEMEREVNNRYAAMAASSEKRVQDEIEALGPVPSAYATTYAAAAAAVEEQSQRMKDALDGVNLNLDEELAKRGVQTVEQLQQQASVERAVYEAMEKDHRDFVEGRVKAEKTTAEQRLDQLKKAQEAEQKARGQAGTLTIQQEKEQARKEAELQRSIVADRTKSYAQRVEALKKALAAEAIAQKGTDALTKAQQKELTAFLKAEYERRKQAAKGAYTKDEINQARQDWVDSEKKAATDVMDTLGNLANAFASLAQISGDSKSRLAKFAQGAAELIGQMNVASQGGASIASGLVEMQKAGGDKFGAGMQIVEGAAGTLSAWQQATDKASRGARALGGALVGAKTGAKIGSVVPVLGTVTGAVLGAAIGGIAGLLKGKPPWAKAADEVGRQFGKDIGDKISRATLDEIGKQAKETFNKNYEAATVFNIDKIIGEAGGLTDKNIAKFTQQLNSVFALVDKGAMSAEQARETIEKNFGTFATFIRNSGKLATQAFQELVQQSADLKIPEVLQFITDEAGRAANAIANLAGPTLQVLQDTQELRAARDELSKQYVEKVRKGDIETGTGGRFDVDVEGEDLELYNQLVQKNLELHKKLAEVIGEEGATLVDSLRDQKEWIEDLHATREELIKQGKATVDVDRQIAEAGDRLTALNKKAVEAIPELGNAAFLLAKTFNTAKGETGDVLAAVQAMVPGLDALKTAYDELGISIEDTALAEMSAYRDRVEANKGLVAQAQALNETALAMSNIGALDSDALKKLENQGQTTYKKLQEAGFSQNESLRMMEGFLESVIQRHKELKEPIDDNTKAMIDQAKAQGLLKDEGQDMTSLLVDGFAAMIEAVGGKLPESFRKFKAAALDAATGTTAAFRGTQQGATTAANAIQAAEQAVIDLENQSANMSATGSKPWQDYQNAVRAWREELEKSNGSVDSLQIALKIANKAVADLQAAGYDTAAEGTAQWKLWRQAVEDQQKAFADVQRALGGVSAAEQAVIDLENRSANMAAVGTKPWLDYQQAVAAWRRELEQSGGAADKLKTATDIAAKALDDLRAAGYDTAAEGTDQWNVYRQAVENWNAALAASHRAIGAVEAAEQRVIDLENERANLAEVGSAKWQEYQDAVKAYQELVAKSSAAASDSLEKLLGGTLEDLKQRFQDPTTFDRFVALVQSAGGESAKSIDAIREVYEQLKAQIYSGDFTPLSDRIRTASSIASGALGTVVGTIGAVNSNLGEVNNQIRSIDWDLLAEEAEAASARAKKAVNTVSFGSSPGGIKEIPLKLDEAGEALRQFAATAVERFSAVRKVVDSLPAPEIQLSVDDRAALEDMRAFAQRSVKEIDEVDQAFAGLKGEAKLKVPLDEFEKAKKAITDIAGDVDVRLQLHDDEALARIEKVQNALETASGPTPVVFDDTDIDRVERRAETLGDSLGKHDFKGQVEVDDVAIKKVDDDVASLRREAADVPITLETDAATKKVGSLKEAIQRVHETAKTPADFIASFRGVDVVQRQINDLERKLAKVDKLPVKIQPMFHAKEMEERLEQLKAKLAELKGDGEEPITASVVVDADQVASAQSSLDQLREKLAEPLAGEVDLAPPDVQRSLTALTAVQEALQALTGDVTVTPPDIAAAMEKVNVLDAALAGLGTTVPIDADADGLGATIEVVRQKLEGLRARVQLDPPDTKPTEAAIDTVSEQLHRVDWETFAREGSEAAEAVKRAVDKVSFGSSPGGIKEIPIQLGIAATALGTFEKTATGHFVSIRKEVDKVSEATADIRLPELIAPKMPNVMATATMAPIGPGAVTGALVTMKAEASKVAKDAGAAAGKTFRGSLATSLGTATGFFGNFGSFFGSKDRKAFEEAGKEASKSFSIGLRAKDANPEEGLGFDLDVIKGRIADLQAVIQQGASGDLITEEQVARAKAELNELLDALAVVQQRMGDDSAASAFGSNVSSAADQAMYAFYQLLSGPVEDIKAALQDPKAFATFMQMAETAGIDTSQSVDDIIQAFKDLHAKIEGSVRYFADFESKSQISITKAADAFSEVVGSIKTMDGQLGTVGWDKFEERGVAAAEAVKKKVNQISFGSSPGGIKEIPIQLRIAMESMQSFARAASEKLGLVRKDVDGVADASMDMLPDKLALPPVATDQLQRAMAEIAATVAKLGRSTGDAEADLQDKLQAQLEETAKRMQMLQEGVDTIDLAPDKWKLWAETADGSADQIAKRVAEMKRQIHGAFDDLPTFDVDEMFQAGSLDGLKSATDDMRRQYEEVVASLGGADRLHEIIKEKMGGNTGVTGGMEHLQRLEKTLGDHMTNMTTQLSSLKDLQPSVAPGAIQITNTIQGLSIVDEEAAHKAMAKAQLKMIAGNRDDLYAQMERLVKGMTK